ncbi:MAG: hypothetical protein JXC32_18695 [Anaerolineae bacterium]|nr:hypothetical protein [Anaerolineae bacterium]
MLKRTEGLAWLVLLLSFFTCITLAIGIPLATRWFVLNSTRPLTIVLEPRGGTITYRAPGSSTTFVVESTTEVEPRGEITLEADGDALLLFYHPDQDEAPIGTIQLYNRTSLVVGNATTPRFGASPKAHHLELQVAQALNMRPSLTGNGRAVVSRIITPQGPIVLERGYFHLIIEQTRSELTVRSGRASVADPNTGESLVLVPLQRTQITDEGLGDIFVGERDLLRTRNGDFGEPLANYWVVYSDAGRDEDNTGTVRQSQLEDGTQYVYFSRAGENWAEVGIRQEINQDIREISSLRVTARFRVDTQTLPVCGSLGTECPVMIRIEFVDSSGGVREWIQGFYAREGENDPLCQRCEWKALHQKIPLDVWYDYDSDDLLPLLRERGISPVAIHAVEVYASGWIFGAGISELAILVGE